MRTHTRMLLGALTAALVLASAVGSASAQRLSIGNANQSFRVVWTPLTLGTASGGGGTQIICNVTLEGSFHYRSIIKLARTLIGFVTKAAVSHPCTGSGEGWADNGVENAGLGVIRNTLPWHVSYEAFTGRLPNITGVRLLLRPVFTINVFGVLCRYSGNAQGVVNINGSGEGTTLVPDSALGVPNIEGSFLCPGNGFFSASTSTERNIITLLGSAAKITITLI
jgi:hypothetical protein